MPADVMVSIGADGTALQTAINKIQKDLDTVANSISGVLDRVGGAVEGLKTMLGGAGTLLQKAFSVTTPAAGIEKLSTAFTALTGNAEEARAVLDSLRQISLESPYDAEAVYRTGQNLLQSGMAGHQVVDIARELAIIAGGDQGKLEALSKAVAKGRQSLKGFDASIIETFASSGLDIVPALEKITGKQGEELKKQIAKGLSFDKVAAAIRDLAAEGGPLAENFDAQASTFSGKIQRVKNLLAAGMQEAGAGINAALGPALDALIAKLQECLPSALAFGEAIGQGLAVAGQIAVQVGEAVRQFFAWFGSLSEPAKMALKAVAAGLLAVKLNAVGAIAAIGPKWTAMCTSMVATWRTAMAAVKGALISSGIGIAIWGAGEIASAIFGGGSSEEYVGQASLSKEAEAAEQETDRVHAAAKDQTALLEAGIGKIASDEDWDALRARIDEQLAEAQQGIDAAEYYSTADAWQKYRDKLLAVSDRLDREGREKALSGELAAAARKEQETQLRLLEQANENARRNAEEYRTMQKAWNNRQEDDAYGQKATDEKGWWLSDAAAHMGVDAGGGDLGAALRAKMDELGSKPHDASVKQQIEDLQHLLEKHLELKKIKEETAKREALHEKEMAVKRATIEGDEKRKRILEDELELEKKMAEYRAQGATDYQAMQKARQDIVLDRAVKEKEDRQTYLESRKSSDSLTTQSGVAIGNGGRSLGIAETSLQETRKQTGLLTSVEKILSTWKPGDIIMGA